MKIRCGRDAIGRKIGRRTHMMDVKRFAEMMGRSCVCKRRWMDEPREFMGMAQFSLLVYQAELSTILGFSPSRFAITTDIIYASTRLKHCEWSMPVSYRCPSRDTRPVSRYLCIGGASSRYYCGQLLISVC